MASGQQEGNGGELPYAPTQAGGVSTQDTALPQRPDSDKLAREVAKTRIANALFAKSEQVKLGRYHLLELVGSGGMGVVWGAFDPELERRVAIKLVKATMQSARDRILLEGQALAKLSHPNVVPVYDVGVVEDQIYLVMEWVRGENLRAYCKQPRSIREILAVYRAAGEGLAAAHAVGLIHRDFKPDNAMRGEDGRVRVLDFGLARGEVKTASSPGSDSAPSSDVTRGAGTPKYMPVEQAEGGPLTPAVDQYAFCVSLREALLGRNADGKHADIPGWIADVIARGTQLEPGDRFESMQALLYALSRDPATIWRRRAVAAGAAVAVGVAFTVGTLRAGGSDVERCVGGRDEITRVWSPQMHETVVRHLQALGRYGAEEAKQLADQLSAYGERWAFAHRNTCLAYERGELTAQLYERSLGCLARDRTAYATVVEVLAAASPERLSGAITVARTLPEAEHCARDTFGTEPAPPPGLSQLVAGVDDSIQRIRTLAQTDDTQAPDRARELVDVATRLGFKPLIARAYLAHGFSLLIQQRIPESVEPLDRAAKLALETQSDAVFVEAFAREIYSIATTAKEDLPQISDGVLQAIPFAEAFSNRLGQHASAARALLFNNIGTTRLALQDRDGAREWFDRSLAEPAQNRNHDVELLATLVNRALVTDDAQQRQKLFAQHRDALTQLLGATHQRTLDSRLMAGMYEENPRLAAKELREVCSLDLQYHAESQPMTVSYCSYEVGWLAEERGDVAEAKAAMAMVKTKPSEIAQSYLLMFDGKLDEAAKLASATAEKLRVEWWSRFKAADAFLLAGLCYAQLGDRPAATKSYTTALATLESITALKRAPSYLRRLARARALVARATNDRELAAKALEWYRSVGGYESAIAQLEPLMRAN